jgi:hypothetical protein
MNEGIVRCCSFFPYMFRHSHFCGHMSSSSHFSEAMVTPIVQLCDIEDVILLESGPKNGYRRCDTAWECIGDIVDTSGSKWDLPGYDQHHVG